MANDAQEYIQQHEPARWHRSTVADGQWMQRNTFDVLNGNDEQLGMFIDALEGKLVASAAALRQAITDEATARENYDNAIVQQLNEASAYLDNAIITEKNARIQGDTDLSAYARACSAYALTTAQNEYNPKIEYVSGQFSEFRTDINGWRNGINTWSADVASTLTTHTSDIGGLKSASADLQSQIDAIDAGSDVADVVGHVSDISPYHIPAGGVLTRNAIIKVLSGGDNQDQMTYYKYTGNKKTTGDVPFDSFTVVGSMPAYYSTAEINTMIAAKADKTELNFYLTKTDAAATYWPKSCSSDYYKKTETSSNSQLTTKFGDYYNKSTIDNTLSMYMSKTGFNEYSAYADTEFMHTSAMPAFKISTRDGYKDVLKTLYNDGAPEIVHIELFRDPDSSTPSCEMYARKANDIALAGHRLQVVSEIPSTLEDNTFYLI
jgi:hypothetical protein